ncbi:hypothetical protein SAMN05444161_3116 [Rhizobiales bacterium GAS191]|nr:hypothetical protein SAMN05444161_3116 [Rhizobiales bacterium GAS191]
MIWAKRRFAYADYSPYFDRLEKLLLADPRAYRQFIMVSTKTDDPGVSDYWIGVPDRTFLTGFDGFEIVGEGDLPKEIDALHIGDATTDVFNSRFQLPH